MGIRGKKDLSNYLVGALLILFFASDAYTQESREIVQKKKYNHVIMAGTWGYTRSIIAATYEGIYRPANNDNLLFAARTGIGYKPGIKIINLKGTTSVPFLLSALIGKNKSFAQVSIGYTASFGHEGIDSTTNPPQKYLQYEASYVLNVGYRFIQFNGATFELTPISLIWTNNPSSKFMWSFGFSVGGVF